jgi:hypothetical protein
MSIRLQPVYFTVPGQEGDFNYMLGKPEYTDFLFLFNDNLEQFLDAIANPRDPKYNPPGGGNACARPWHVTGDAFGIPTGPFETLDQDISGRDKRHKTAKDIIDLAFLRVKMRCLQGGKTVICYSVENPGSKRIGLGIFAGLVGSEVVDYITQKIQEIPEEVEYSLRWSRWKEEQRLRDLKEKTLIELLKNQKKDGI